MWPAFEAQQAEPPTGDVTVEQVYPDAEEEFYDCESNAYPLFCHKQFSSDGGEVVDKSSMEWDEDLCAVPYDYFDQDDEEETWPEEEGLNDVDPENWIQYWLSDARAEQQLPSYIPNRNITISIGEYFTANRRPGEKLWLPPEITDERGYRVQIDVGDNVDVSWCCMLYGKDATVEPFAVQAMLLGYQLNTLLEPALSKRGLTFRNVMFVTQEAVNEGLFKAIAHFWSIQIVSLPEVHEKMQEAISPHLKAGHLDCRHVFLKAFAWQQKSKVAVITDLDVMITSGEKMAEALSRFADPGDEWGKLLAEGKVAVMDRVLSHLGPQLEPKLDFPLKNKKGSRGMSYCMAIVKPCPDEAARYLEELRQEPPKEQIGKLSDQNFLNEFLKEKYVLLQMSIMMFMSWFHHDDQIHKFAGDLVAVCKDWCRSLGKNVKSNKTVIDVDEKHPLFHMDFVKHLAQEFGAVHCSAAFNLSKERTRKEHVDICMTRAKVHLINLPPSLAKFAPEGFSKRNFVENLQWNLFRFLRDYRQRQIMEIYQRVQKSMGHVDAKIESGLAAAHRLLTDEFIREMTNKHQKEIEQAKKSAMTAAWALKSFEDEKGKGGSQAAGSSDWTWNDKRHIWHPRWDDRAKNSGSKRSRKDSGEEDPENPPWRSSKKHKKE